VHQTAHDFRVYGQLYPWGKTFHIKNLGKTVREEKSGKNSYNIPVEKIRNGFCP
jgi:hypothetical protein